MALNTVEECSAVLACLPCTWELFFLLRKSTAYIISTTEAARALHWVDSLSHAASIEVHVSHRQMYTFQKQEALLQLHMVNDSKVSGTLYLYIASH